MTTSSLTGLLGQARKDRYAIASFNVFSLNTARAAIAAAEAERSPVVLAFAASHAKYADFDSLAAGLVSLAARATVPTVLHLDHAESLGLVTRAIQAGFGSVMFDGYGLSPGEKTRQTASVTDLAHSAGITVEAEFGHITKVGEDEGRRDELLLDPAEVARFVDETRIDIVASAVGSVHGLEAGRTNLRLDLLQSVADQVTCFLSLHGGSGMSDDTVGAAIKIGVVKFSYFTGLSTASVNAAAKRLGARPYPRLTELDSLMMQAFQEQAQAKIRLYGASGRA
jgi:ketose-bisphosphate aldolase